MKIPFVGPTYNLDDRPASVQRTINMCPLPNEPGNERTDWVFKDAPGLSLFSEPAPVPPPPPPPTGLIGSTSATSNSTSVTPTLPSGLLSGDAVVWFALHQNGITFSNNLTAWPQIGEQVDSSGGTRFRFFGRILDGTAADTDIGYTVSTAPSAWGFVAFRVLNDSRFPSSFVGSGTDYKFISSLNPSSVTKPASTDQFAMVAGWLVSSVAPGSGGEAFSSMPTGYTQLANETLPSYIQGGTTFYAHLAVAYRTLVGSSEDPGAFGTTGGALVGDEALTFLVSYAP